MTEGSKTDLAVGLFVAALIVLAVLARILT